MDAEAKSERLGGLRAVKIKACGFRKDGVISTGGGQPEGSYPNPSLPTIFSDNSRKTVG
jgi:hypothetical protein